MRKPGKTKSKSLHERIQGEISANIMSGKLKPGDRIPIEQTLMQRYDCSRMTVNKAISMLVAAGLISRNRKAGSFVTRPRIHLAALTIPDVRQEIESRHAVYSINLVSRRVLIAGKANMDSMSTPRGSSVLFLVCQHLANGKVFALEERHISLCAVPSASEVDFSVNSPGTWLLAHVPWTKAEHHIFAIIAGSRSRLLEVRKGAPCLVLERNTWRNSISVTHVQQIFASDDFGLVARFGSE